MTAEIRVAYMYKYNTIIRAGISMQITGLGCVRF